MRPAGSDGNPFARQNQSLENAGRLVRQLGGALMPAIQKAAGESSSKTPVVMASNEPAPKKPGEGTKVDVPGK